MFKLFIKNIIISILFLSAMAVLIASCLLFLYFLVWLGVPKILMLILYGTLIILFLASFVTFFDGGIITTVDNWLNKQIGIEKE